RATRRSCAASAAAASCWGTDRSRRRARQPRYRGRRAPPLPRTARAGPRSGSAAGASWLGGLVGALRIVGAALARLLAAHRFVDRVAVAALPRRRHDQRLGPRHARELVGAIAPRRRAQR